MDNMYVYWRALPLGLVLTLSCNPGPISTPTYLFLRTGGVSPASISAKYCLISSLIIICFRRLFITSDHPDAPVGCGEILCI